MSDTVATLVARAALAGFTLRQLGDGTFIAERWGHFVALTDERAVSAWLGRVAGKRASPWATYESGKAGFLAANPHASADEIEDHTKRLARREGL